MKAEELLKKFNMSPHKENGRFCECHYKYDGVGRADSGSGVFYAILEYTWIMGEKI